MSTLTKTYYSIFRDILPREYPSTNNIVFFCDFITCVSVIGFPSIRQKDFCPSWFWFVLPLR